MLCKSWEDEKNNNLSIGRDALFDLLAKNKMLVRKRNRCTFTTTYQ